MDECRILFLNAARRKKQEDELRCFPLASFGMLGIALPPRKSAEIIDLDAVRAVAKLCRGD